MIKNTKQDWSIGKTVKVGFLSLTVVKAKQTPGDYLPDAYLLSRGEDMYEFVPHNGLTKLPTSSVSLSEMGW